MRFSTSAVLATVAICAGQTFAVCRSGPPPAGKTQQTCNLTDQDNYWQCDSGDESVLVHLGDDLSTISVGSMDMQYSFKFACSQHPDTFVTISCDANTFGWTTSLACPKGDSLSVFNYV